MVEQQVVALERLGQFVEEGEPGEGAVGHADGDRPVECDDRAGDELPQLPVEAA